jgi:hypothetical protein
VLPSGSEKRTRQSPNAKAVLGRIYALKLFDIARASENQTLDSSGDSQAIIAVQTLEVNLGLVCEDKFLHEGSV